MESRNIEIERKPKKENQNLLRNQQTTEALNELFQQLPKKKNKVRWGEVRESYTVLCLRSAQLWMSMLLSIHFTKARFIVSIFRLFHSHFLAIQHSTNTENATQRELAGSRYSHHLISLWIASCVRAHASIFDANDQRSKHEHIRNWERDRIHFTHLPWMRCSPTRKHFQIAWKWIFYAMSQALCFLHSIQFAFSWIWKMID